MIEDKHIKCVDCKYVRADKSASSKNWTAFECGNADSEFYRCLLNVTKNGERQFQVTWCGCECGRKAEARRAV